jgi:hypothetical protein
MLKTALLRPRQWVCTIFGKAIAEAIVAMKSRRKFPAFAARQRPDDAGLKKAATSKKPGAAALYLAFRPSSLAACANPLAAGSSRPALVAQPKHRRVLPKNKLAFGIAAFFIKMHSLLFVFLQA